jgi:hypothetical protein
MLHCRADFPHLLETPSCTDVIRNWPGGPDRYFANLSPHSSLLALA